MKHHSPRFILVLAFVLAIPSTALGSPTTSGAEDSVTTNGLRATSGLLAALPPGGTFVDDNGHQFEGAIEAIAAERITSGCNPPTNDRFCLEDDVTRGEMAVFLARAFGYGDDAKDYFEDDDGRFYEAAANRIRHEGVTQGCNPPTNNRYCGEKPITRGQMAALMVRALGLDDDGGGDLFDDDDDSIYEDAIDRLGAAGITSGCNPPDNDEFCPTRPVTRGQMAVFIARALGLSPITPPPAHGATRPPGETVSGTITGKACPNGCVVIGNATLKGDIDLQGDLAVFGGTLVARPGVDLDGDGHQITFSAGGKADFQGTETFTWSGDGSNANVERDITFRNMRRIMFHQGAGKSTLRYFSVVDSGTSVLGDYPIHFHLNGNSTRGTLVEGVAVVDGKHHAFVPHGSHGITFRDTIALNTTGTPYWWDPPGANNCTSQFEKNCTADNSNDTVFNRALANGVTPMPGDRGYRLAGFKLEAGSGNVVTNSSAINVGGQKDCSGFHWPESANQNVGGNVWVFHNNHGQSNCHGIFVWQNDSNLHIIDGFSGGGIDHGAYSNRYEYRNVEIPYLEIVATGWTMKNSSIGKAVARSHNAEGTVKFTNVSFESLIIDDAGKEPATYVLEDSNLDCSDIVIKELAPGSRITVDGKEC